MPATAEAASAPAKSVVVFGDSVPYGSMCGCAAFGTLYARALSDHNGWNVATTNLSKSGAKVRDVRALLSTASAQAAVRRATTVLVMVGANDFQGAFAADRQDACPASGCYANTAQHLKLSMIDILQTITKVHTGPVSIVVLDYWDVVEDGAIGARDYGPQGAAKSQNATTYANAALHAAAQATRGGFVSTRVAFRGPDNDRDPTPLLAHDGDHPNASGHAGIARALSNNRPHG